MSLIVSVYTHEGIVMAADSRLTLSAGVAGSGGTDKISFEFSNATSKLFCTPGGVGISTCGVADIAHRPIAGYIETFAADQSGTCVEVVAQALLQCFRELKPDLGTLFHVGGYAANKEQALYVVSVLRNSVAQVNPPGQQGAKWDGEVDTLTKILKATWLSDDSGKPTTPLGSYDIPWDFFGLQDAIDFCIFAMAATSGAIRFQNRIKTVGGPIDMLVVKPREALWIQRKQLHGEKTGELGRLRAGGPGVAGSASGSARTTLEGRSDSIQEPSPPFRDHGAS